MPEYLYRRPGSEKWWIKLQPPKDARDGFKLVQKSLGTAIKADAEIAALPLILEHKRKLREHVVMRKANSMTSFFDIGRFLAEALPEAKTGEKRKAPAFSDEGIVETWVEQRYIDKYDAADTRKVLATLKELVPDKKLRDMDRDDGRKLRDFLLSKYAPNTVGRKIGHLAAAVNLAIADKKLSFNPLSGILEKGKKVNPRRPLTDADMVKATANLHLLRAEDRLLWLWLAHSGARLAEPFAVTEEQEEGGVRYVIYDKTKTEESERRSPLPEAILPHLPAKITGPLFKDAPDVVGKRLRRWLRGLDISHDAERGTGSKSKTVHSLRHRAKDRLRAAECPLEVQFEILGHEDKTISADYGRGSPVPLLKRWIDKI